MSGVGEILVQRVEKINAEKKTTTARVAQLGGIDVAAAEYIAKVHRRLAAEEAAAAAAATAAAK
jgi:hypothetical protein